MNRVISFFLIAAIALSNAWSAGAMSVSPRDASWSARYTWKGYTYLATGKYKKAERGFAKALKYDPSNIMALEGMGDMKRFDGDSAGALPWYSKVDAFNNGASTQYASFRIPTYGSVNTRFFDTRAQCAKLAVAGFTRLAKGDPAQAAQYFQQALQLDATFLYAKMGLDEALSRTGGNPNPYGNTTAPPPPPPEDISGGDDD